MARPNRGRYFFGEKFRKREFSHTPSPRKGNWNFKQSRLYRETFQLQEDKKEPRGGGGSEGVREHIFYNTKVNPGRDRSQITYWWAGREKN